MIRVKLLRQNRIDGAAGDIVMVSPARADFLIGLGLAEPAEREKETPGKGKKAENPESGNQTGSQEKAKSKKTTRGK